jgi:hypothetical protein
MSPPPTAPGRLQPCPKSAVMPAHSKSRRAGPVQAWRPYSNNTANSRFTATIA